MSLKIETKKNIKKPPHTLISDIELASCSAGVKKQKRFLCALAIVLELARAVFV